MTNKTRENHFNALL